MLLQQKQFIVTVAAAAGLALAAAAHAQTSTQAPPPAGPPAVNRAAGLNLTQTQRDQIRELRQGQRKDMRALRAKTRAARQALREAMRADVPDEAAVRSAAGAVAALEADRAVLRSRAKGRFMGALTPEQREQVKRKRVR